MRKFVTTVMPGLIGLAPAPSGAQNWPQKTIRFIVPGAIMS